MALAAGALTVIGGLNVASAGTLVAEGHKVASVKGGESVLADGDGGFFHPGWYVGIGAGRTELEPEGGSISLHLDWLLRPVNNPFNAFLRAGVSSIDNSVSDDAILYDRDDDVAVSYGAGVQWRGKGRWMAQLTYEHIAEDAQWLGLTVGAYLGKSLGATSASGAMAGVAALARAPDILVEVVGHTDSQGDAAYNQNLSEQRAKTVRDFLAAQPGVMTQISWRGAGEAEPLVANTTADGRMQNRRIELVFDNRLVCQN